jgi:hypothetical protein
MKSCVVAVLLLVSCGLWAVEQPSAQSVAANIIRARALSCGDGEIGKQLRLLADGVEAGRIDIAQARQVLELVTPAPTASLEPIQPPPAKPAVTAQQVTALLDGVAPSAQQAEPVAPIDDASPAPEKPAFATTVLAVNRSGANDLIMIGAGAKDGIKEGRRFAIRRLLKTIVTCSVIQVKDTMSVCQIIPGTYDEAGDSVREGDDAIAVE